MKQILVGSTGFVGGNLCRYEHFDAVFRSANIEQSFAMKPDVLYFAGIRAEKFLANRDPERDLDAIREAIRNIERIAPRSIVLISTVDVYGASFDCDEDTRPFSDTLQAYGKNRLLLEQFVASYTDDHLIVRLPALYGDNLKKNLIFDMLHPIPSVLSEPLMKKLGFSVLSAYYLPFVEGFFKLRELTDDEYAALLAFLQHAGFSTLSFTDADTTFQFYSLEYLAGHIRKAREADLSLVNLVTEPCEAEELYKHIYGEESSFFSRGNPARYDIRTKHAALFGGKEGYLFDRDFVMQDVKNFVFRKIAEAGGAN